MKCSALNVLRADTERNPRFLNSLSLWFLFVMPFCLYVLLILLVDVGLCTCDEFCIQSVVAEISSCQETATMLEYVILSLLFHLCFFCSFEILFCSYWFHVSPFIHLGVFALHNNLFFLHHKLFLSVRMFSLFSQHCPLDRFVS